MLKILISNCLSRLLILVVLSILCSACYSYRVYPKEYRKLYSEQPRRSVYVQNDSLSQELSIIIASNLFDIITDSTEADLTLKLYPIQQSFVCGQPLTFSMITLGQIPIILPDRYIFRFDEIDNKVVTERVLELKIAQRVWFWDMFIFNKNFEQNAVKALLGEYLSNEK